MATNNSTLANIGVDVEVNLSLLSAIYLVAVLVIGSFAFFAFKKYL